MVRRVDEPSTRRHLIRRFLYGRSNNTAKPWPTPTHSVGCPCPSGAGGHASSRWRTLNTQTFDPPISLRSLKQHGQTQTNAHAQRRVPLPLWGWGTYFVALTNSQHADIW